MLFPVSKSLLLAVSAATAANAHTIFSNFFVDGVNQGDAKCVRMSNINSAATNPIKGIESKDMGCGVNGENGVARVCPVDAGSVITFEYRTWPDASQPGAIDISHKGPCAVYMKKVDDASASNNCAGPGWFKIFQEDYDSGSKKWCTEKLIDNDGHLSVKLPSDIQGGHYLLRPELLALHQADKSPADPQFYVGAAQIFVNGEGTAVPTDTVSIPGYVSMEKNNAAMTFNIWNPVMALPFPQFGPAVYTSNAKRSLETRAAPVQSVGLTPANCILENGNWCGTEVPNYSSESGCWDSSEKCWAQSTTCYDTAGPTGSKNCHLWESKCEAIQQACGSGNFNGPPNKGEVLTPALKKVTLPAPENSSGTVVSGSSGSSTKAPQPSPAENEGKSAQTTTPLF